MSDTRIVIHVRFAPNGEVTEIGERPASLAPQQWFDLLSRRREAAYQPLAGGRGVFRLTRGVLDALKAESTPSAA